MPEGDELLLVVLAFGLLACPGGLLSFFLWVKVLSRRARLFPLPRFRPITWKGHEVFLAIALLVLVPGFAHSFLTSINFFEAYYGKDPAPDRQLIWIMLLGAPLMVALILMALHYLSGTRPADLGLSTVRLPQNLLAGYLGWLLLAPLVWGLNLLVVQYLEPQPHPFEKLLRGAGLIEWALIFLEALIGAPVYEELVFRGVLQGWLRKAPLAGHCTLAGGAFLATSLSWLNYLLDPKGPAEPPQPGPTIFVSLLIPLYLYAAYRLAGKKPSQPEAAAPAWEKEQPSLSDQVPARTDSPPAPPPDAEPVLSGPEKSPRALGFLAIGGTSLLFATFHSHTWPAPIPLFFLSLGLGWLAQRTQSLVGPMVVHGLFNGISCLSLLMQEMAGMNH